MPNFRSCECEADNSLELEVSGPILKVRIGLDEQYRGNGIPNLPQSHYSALVDTGSSRNCIDSSLAQKLDLPISDEELVSGAGGVFEAKVYLAQIYVPKLKYTVSGNFHGVVLEDGGQPYKALIGRAFLRNFTMRYDGPRGKVTLTLKLN